MVAGIVLGAGAMLSTANATGVPGESASNPIVVASPNDVPQGAIEDEVSTFVTDNECDTTRSWVLTVHHPAVTHVVHHDAVTHTVHHDAVTHVIHHDAVPAVYGPDLWWNWSPNYTHGPQDYTPEFPNDERGTWQGPHENGGPDQDTYGTFNSSNGNSGNSSWFHREHGELITPGQDAYDETVVDQEAYDEVIVDQEAFDETVTDQEASDEVTFYAWTDGVTCTTDTPTPTPTPTPPVDNPSPKPPVNTPHNPSGHKPPAALAPPVARSLPNAGLSDTANTSLFVGLGLLIAGSGLLLLSRKRA